MTTLCFNIVTNIILYLVFKPYFQDISTTIFFLFHVYVSPTVYLYSTKNEIVCYKLQPVSNLSIDKSVSFFSEKSLKISALLSGVTEVVHLRYLVFSSIDTEF